MESTHGDGDDDDEPSQEITDHQELLPESDDDDDDDHHHHRQQRQVQEAAASPARSYDCTFCKRGFSNAQALGGHMNIHRKDKAMLKQSSTDSSSNQQSYSLDISKIRASYSHQIPTVRPSSSSISQAMGSGSNVIPERRSSTPSPWPDRVLSGGEHDRYFTLLGEFRQRLPLPDERSSSPLRNDQGGVIGSSSSSSQDREDLDLELRLGHQPRKGSSSTSPKDTKKFF